MKIYKSIEEYIQDSTTPTITSFPVLEIVPITLSEANDFVDNHHRHHKRVVGHKFSIGLSDGKNIVGVIIVGRPVARRQDSEFTLEVTRCCTDGTPNSSSKLYASAWRAAKSLGYKRLITFTLKTEPGISLRAAGWKIIGETKGGSWNVKSRPRVDKHTLQERFKWEKT